MWMMGCNDARDFSIADSFNGSRKLRPLIPRLPSATPSQTTNTPCFGNHIHGTDHLALNHHLAEQSKRDQFNAQQVVVSSRWNPTSEQLQTLEELYRMGTRTPSAEQIQQITAQLRRYGKIEGKNVFYWFQNHKARERQKRRRQLESPSLDHQPEALEKKETGASRTGCFEEVEQQTKNWSSSTTNCSTLAEKTDSMQRTAKAVVSECRAADGWLQFNERELQQYARSLVETNATWQTMQRSRSPPTNLINYATTTSSTAIPATVQSMEDHHLNIFIAPCRDINHMVGVGEGCQEEESQTLQLFPLRSSDGNQKCGDEDGDVSNAALNAGSSFTPPCQFFEFLPLKN
ncbi:hypothetical protein RJ640_000634 [Escallonia rubra]|uniref:Homeobox domain-containing protein n=1 Tax=Escallonia rubra TaxID=112253 RepID=A0AA88UI96_9ASTE|nr:hypothetical protein RJ640_000634 [Escallonia rubra]